MSGPANLDGTLTVNLIGSFTPLPGDVFQILTFPGSAGTFATFSLPPGGSFNPSNGTVSF